MSFIFGNGDVSGVEMTFRPNKLWRLNLQERYVFVKGLYCIFSVICHDCRRLCGMVRRSNYIITWPYFGMVINSSMGGTLYISISMVRWIPCNFSHVIIFHPFFLRAGPGKAQPSFCMQHMMPALRLATRLPQSWSGGEWCMAMACYGSKIGSNEPTKSDGETIWRYKMI